MDAALYLNHPYGRPVIGWRPEIEKLTRDEALAFYRRFYTPNNAIVVIAGDVTADEVKADAEATYGKIAPRAEIAPRRRPMEPAAGSAADRYACRRAGSSSRASAGSISAPSRHHREARREPGAGSSGACARRRRERPSLQNLVVEQNVALNAGAYYSSTALDYGKLGVYGVPAPGKTLHDVGTAIDAIIADVSEHGVTADELALAKNRLIADAVYAQDNQATLARWYGAALATGETVDMVRNWPDEIRAVTAEAVRDAARTWFNRRASVTGYLVNSLPAKEKHS